MKNMKFNGDTIPILKYRNQTLIKTMEIYNRLTNEDCINELAKRIVNTNPRIVDTQPVKKRINSLCEPILHLMDSIVYDIRIKNLYDIHGNYIGPINTFVCDEPDKQTHFANIHIRKQISKMITNLLSIDSATREDTILSKLVKAMIECALNTKSVFQHYKSTIDEGGIYKEAIETQRRYFRLDFFFNMRNKTVADLMNIPAESVTVNTICKNYLYDNSCTSQENEEKALTVTKTLCKNILKEIPLQDLLNFLIIDQDRMFKWNINLLDLTEYYVGKYT